MFNLSNYYNIDMQEKQLQYLNDKYNEENIYFYNIA